jgi:hypothetical protein
MASLDKPFQRIGSKSDSQVGRDFEKAAKRYFEAEGLILNLNLKLPVGIGPLKKDHAFDLGCVDKKVIVECKSHTWTVGKKVPSAKLTVWNEAMYYFVSAPEDFRKILFVLRDYCKDRDETLAEYYIRRYSHLIPKGVELCEYDEGVGTAKFLSIK